MNRNQEIALCFYRNGQDDVATGKMLGVTPSTIRRAVRRFKQTDKPQTPAKIFITDIETAQMIVKVWQLRKNDFIQHHRIIKDWFVMMWTGKWLLSNEVLGDCVTPAESIARDDSRILESIWKLLNSADIIVGHNVKNFDLKKLNARFLKYRQLPPSPYNVVDTLHQSRQNFGFSSHKLDFITGYLELPQKLETNIDLWDKCEEGDIKALNEMFEYCKNDVVINEEVYIELLPYMKSHPNVRLFSDMGVEGCPNCGSTDIEKLETFYVTPANKYPSFRCNACGKPSHSRTSIVSTEQRKNLLSSDAK